jgi:hypothetical protein
MALKRMATWLVLAMTSVLTQDVGVQAERVPDAAVVGGVPQGLFVGRSLLTGRAVCLLFMSGGRVTRAIPEGGLENIDWVTHQATHSGDVGRWELRGGVIAIVWGDGSVHQGPLTVRADGIEFYGKRYTRPVPVALAALVGRWESTRGPAIAGGSGINAASTLAILTDGRYEWSRAIGGVVAGRAVAADNTATGVVTVKGSTIFFTPNAGPATSHTFLPAAGTPLTAFSVDANLFTRVP